VSASVLDEATTLTGAFAELVRRYPDFECLTILRRDQTDDRFTLGSLWQRAHRVRAMLEARGFGTGRVVLLILPTGADLVAAYFGTMLAGHIPALLAGATNRFADHATYAALVRVLVENADAAAVYCDPDVAGILRSSLEWAGPILTSADLPMEHSGEAVPTASGDAPATMQYSSGSTGVPKGVVLTHRSMLNNIRAVREGLSIGSDDVSVNWIPLYHDMGLIDGFLLPLLSGCPTVLMPTTDFMREPGRWLWAMHAYRGTMSWAPNFAYALCVSRIPPSDLAGLDLSSWRLALNAAEPVLPETIAAFTRRFQPHGFRPEAMTPAWGLAENVTLATSHPIDRAPTVEIIDRHLLNAGVAKPTTSGTGIPSVAVGRCLPRCGVEIRDAGGVVQRERSLGTIWLRSDSLFTGYHRDPLLTRRVLVDGWLNTGDRGYLSEGDLFFVSREKDLIVVGGEKYSPHHIESLINQVPGVRQGCAVVFGVLNSERGTEEVVAVVETREENDGGRTRLQEAIGREVRLKTGLILRQVLLVPPGGVQKTTSGKLARSATHQRWATALSIEAGSNA
jgi:acyl-CoA synthetase (AMP-forming)/AMP-acid ligase II